MLKRLSLIALMVSAANIGVVSANTKTELVEISSNIQDARLEAIELCAQELVAIRSASLNYFDALGVWPATMVDLVNSSFWVADGVSNYNTPFIAAPDGAGNLIVSVDVLQESTALSIAPRAQGTAIGTVVTVTVQPSGNAVLFNSLLHREAVPGSPELNQMNTTLDMNNNNIINVANLDGDSLDFRLANIREDITVQRDGHFNRNISVDDTATIANLDAEQAKIDDLQVLNTLTVDGTANLNGTTNMNGTLNIIGELNVQTGSLTNLDVETIKATNLAELNGGLIVNNGAEINDGLTVTGGLNFDTGTGVSLTLTDTLTAKDGSFTGSVNIDQDLTVNGTSNLNNVNANDINMTGNLNVDGGGLFGGDLEADNITANSNLLVKKDTVLNGTLVVDGTSQFNDVATFRSHVAFETNGNTGNFGFDGTNFTMDRDLFINGEKVATEKWTEDNFFNKTESDDRFVNAAGDTMTGQLGLPSILLDDILLMDSEAGRVFFRPFDDSSWQTSRDFGYDNVSNRWYTEADFEAKGNLYENGDRVATRDWSEGRFYIKDEDIVITKDAARLVLQSSTAGTPSVEQAATISLGESGVGHASLHLAYQGDGYSYIGMGSLGADNIPDNWAMRLYYNSRDVCFKRSDTLSTVCATDFAVKHEKNVFTADQEFAEDVIVRGNLQIGGDLTDVDGNPYLRNDQDINAQTLDSLDSLQFLRSDVKDIAEQGFTVMVPGSSNAAFNTGSGIRNSTSDTRDVELFYDGQLKAYTNSDGLAVVGEVQATSAMLTGDLVANDAILDGESVKQFMDDCRNQNGICEGGNGGFTFVNHTAFMGYMENTFAPCPWAGDDWVFFNVPSYDGRAVGCATLSYAAQGTIADAGDVTCTVRNSGTTQSPLSIGCAILHKGSEYAKVGSNFSYGPNPPADFQNPLLQLELKVVYGYSTSQDINLQLAQNGYANTYQVSLAGNNGNCHGCQYTNTYGGLVKIPEPNRQDWEYTTPLHPGKLANYYTYWNGSGSKLYNFPWSSNANFDFIAMGLSNISIQQDTEAGTDVMGKYYGSPTVPNSSFPSWMREYKMVVVHRFGLRAGSNDRVVLSNTYDWLAMNAGGQRYPRDWQYNGDGQVYEAMTASPQMRTNWKESTTNATASFNFGADKAMYVKSPAFSSGYGHFCKIVGGASMTAYGQENEAYDRCSNNLVNISLFEWLQHDTLYKP